MGILSAWWDYVKWFYGSVWDGVKTVTGTNAPHDETKEGTGLCGVFQQVSPWICEVQTDNEGASERWFKFLGPNGGSIAAVLVLGTPIFVAGYYAVRLLDEVVPDLAAVLRDAWWLVEEPARLCWQFVRNSYAWTHWGMLWLADYTNTYIQLWYLVFYSAIVLAVTEIGYQLTLAAWRNDEFREGWFGKTYHFLADPLENLYAWWQGYFSKWNPIRYAILVPLTFAYLTGLCLLPLLVLGNPLYWLSRVK